MRKKTASVVHSVLIFLLVCSSKTQAQFSMTGQLRTRVEFRDGYATILPKSATPAFFTSQRTRLGFNYSMYRFKFNVSIQDVRVWGQDASTINTTTTANNNAFQVHEASAEILLSDTGVKSKTLNLKIGRQEIIYDDQRLLGNSDYLQQARTFDAALVKYEMKKYIFHLGLAYNQNQQNLSGTIYNSAPAGNYAANSNGGSMYKSFEYFYANKKLNKGNVSFLFFADQFSKYHNETVSGVISKVYDKGTITRATTGLYFNNVFNKLAVTASAYYQFGNNSAAQKLSAVLLTAYGQYSFTKKTAAGLGVDYYSGGVSGTTSKAFDPLYGTPHKFAGLMDYYYAISGFGKAGLVDYYLKTKYKPSDKCALSADFHLFNNAASTAGFDTKNLGQEIDLTATYMLTKQISFEAVYGHYFSTSLLTSGTVKNVANAKAGGNWAYISVNIKPEFLFK